MAAALAAACSTPPVDSADWVVPLPEGTPVIEYEPVSDEQRAGNRIELVRELVIGDRVAAGGDYFFRFVDGWKDLTVDRDGNIYVVDTLNYRVQVFDPDGRYVRTLGPRGEGPGELSQYPRAVAIAGDRIVVAPTAGALVNEWSLAGDFLRRRDLGVGSNITRLAGTDGGDVIGSYEEPIVSSDVRHVVRVARLLPPAARHLVYLERADPPVEEDFEDLTSSDPPFVMLGVARPTFAVTRSGEVYVTPGDEYQILALDVSGRARWALRIGVRRQIPTERELDALLQHVRAAGASPEEREWFGTANRQGLQVVGPWPAIGSIHVDGHGHLYVFPEMAEFPGTYSERPVDVYSSAGERLFSGFIPVSKSTISRLAYAVTTLVPMLPREPGWSAARGDHIYTSEQDVESGEDVVVRYRLVEPF